jgi:diadenylate cyclase
MAIIPLVRWQSGVDFIVLTTVIYWLLNWARQTRVLRLFVGIGALVLTGSLARRLDLVITAWVLHVAAITAVVLLVLVYHSEIRHALTHLDPLNRLVRAVPTGQPSDSVAIAEAAFALAATHRGALIVLSGNDPLENILIGGVPLGGRVSQEILEAIFRKASPVHDGAVVIEGGRIARVGVLLPLANREDVPNFYGTRHRAALGLAELTDAKVIVVSEERGQVSLVDGPTLRKMKTAAELLQQMQRPEQNLADLSNHKVGRRLLGNWRLKLSALGIASLIWVLVFMTGSSVRTFTVPIEFENVPAGLEIAEPANAIIAVQLRAATRLFSTLDESQLVARVDLSGMKEGLHNLAVQADNLSLPPGILLEQALPPSVRVRLVARQAAGVSPDLAPLQKEEEK